MDTPPPDSTDPPPNRHEGGALSPLSGCYLLIVISEPHTEDHREVILSKLREGFLAWDDKLTNVDLNKELQIIEELNLEGEEQRGGERLIQYATEHLVVEILIHPQVNTLQQCLKNLLSSFTKHRHIIHAGYAFAETGSWMLQDGTFSYSDIVAAFGEYEVQRVLHAYEGSISIDIHCEEEGNWCSENFQELHLSNLCSININPHTRRESSEELERFVAYMSRLLNVQKTEDILKPSDIVGNIRFSRPTLYVFPGGQGDSALFGINGFNMLVDGGYNYKACFWDFTRHLDRLDAVLVTRLNTSNVMGITKVIQRKAMTPVYPQIGHFFCNVSGMQKSPGVEKKRTKLLVNIWSEGHAMRENLKRIGLKTNLCFCDNSMDPINLYHKVGHGKLDMYILNPPRDSQELKDFMQRWQEGCDQNSSGYSSFKSGRSFPFPITNSNSICALVIWQPSDVNDTITRILFPGSTPQHKIIEGLEKMKKLECIKHKSCTARLLRQKPSLRNKQIESSSDISSHIRKSRKESSVIREVKKQRKTELSKFEARFKMQQEIFTDSKSEKERLRTNKVLTAPMEKDNKKKMKDKINGEIGIQVAKQIKKEADISNMDGGMKEKSDFESMSSSDIAKDKSSININEQYHEISDEIKESSIVSIESGIILVDDRESSLEIEQIKDTQLEKEFLNNAKNKETANVTQDSKTGLTTSTNIDTSHKDIKKRQEKTNKNVDLKSDASYSKKKDVKLSREVKAEERKVGKDSLTKHTDIKRSVQHHRSSTSKEETKNRKPQSRDYLETKPRKSKIESQVDAQEKRKIARTRTKPKSDDQITQIKPQSPKAIKAGRPLHKDISLSSASDTAQEDRSIKSLICEAAVSAGVLAAAATGLSVTEASIEKEEDDINKHIAEDEVLIISGKAELLPENDEEDRISDIVNMPGVQEIKITDADSLIPEKSDSVQNSNALEENVQSLEEVVQEGKGVTENMPSYQSISSHKYKKEDSTDADEELSFPEKEDGSEKEILKKNQSKAGTQAMKPDESVQGVEERTEIEETDEKEDVYATLPSSAKLTDYKQMYEDTPIAIKPESDSTRNVVQSPKDLINIEGTTDKTGMCHDDNRQLEISPAVTGDEIVKHIDDVKKSHPQRDGVKTPDEVEDLPIHEEVYINEEESVQSYKEINETLMSSSNLQGSKLDDNSHENLICSTKEAAKIDNACFDMSQELDRSRDMNLDKDTKEAPSKEIESDIKKVEPEDEIGEGKPDVVIKHQANIHIDSSEFANQADVPDIVLKDEAKVRLHRDINEIDIKQDDTNTPYRKPDVPVDKSTAQIINDDKDDLSKDPVSKESKDVDHEGQRPSKSDMISLQKSSDTMAVKSLGSDFELRSSDDSKSLKTTPILAPPCLESKNLDAEETINFKPTDEILKDNEIGKSEDKIKGELFSEKNVSELVPEEYEQISDLKSDREKTGKINIEKHILTPREDEVSSTLTQHTTEDIIAKTVDQTDSSTEQDKKSQSQKINEKQDKSNRTCESVPEVSFNLPNVANILEKAPETIPQTVATDLKQDGSAGEHSKDNDDFAIVQDQKIETPNLSVEKTTHKTDISKEAIIKTSTADLATFDDATYTPTERQLPILACADNLTDKQQSDAAHNSDLRVDVKDILSGSKGDVESIDIEHKIGNISERKEPADSNKEVYTVVGEPDRIKLEETVADTHEAKHISVDTDKSQQIKDDYGNEIEEPISTEATTGYKDIGHPDEEKIEKIAVPSSTHTDIQQTKDTKEDITHIKELTEEVKVSIITSAKKEPESEVQVPKPSKKEFTSPETQDVHPHRENMSEQSNKHLDTYPETDVKSLQPNIKEDFHAAANASSNRESAVETDALKVTSSSIVIHDDSVTDKETTVEEKPSTRDEEVTKHKMSTEPYAMMETMKEVDNKELGQEPIAPISSDNRDQKNIPCDSTKDFSEKLEDRSSSPSKNKEDGIRQSENIDTNKVTYTSSDLDSKSLGKITKEVEYKATLSSIDSKIAAEYEMSSGDSKEQPMIEQKDTIAENLTVERMETHPTTHEEIEEIIKKDIVRDVTIPEERRGITTELTDDQKQCQDTDIHKTICTSTMKDTGNQDHVIEFKKEISTTQSKVDDKKIPDDEESRKESKLHENTELSNLPLKKDSVVDDQNSAEVSHDTKCEDNSSALPLVKYPSQQQIESPLPGTLMTDITTKTERLQEDIVTKNGNDRGFLDNSNQDKTQDVKMTEDVKTTGLSDVQNLVDVERIAKTNETIDLEELNTEIISKTVPDHAPAHEAVCEMKPRANTEHHDANNSLLKGNISEIGKEVGKDIFDRDDSLKTKCEIAQRQLEGEAAEHIKDNLVSEDRFEIAASAVDENVLDIGNVNMKLDRSHDEVGKNETKDKPTESGDPLKNLIEKSAESEKKPAAIEQVQKPVVQEPVTITRANVTEKHDENTADQPSDKIVSKTIDDITYTLSDQTLAYKLDKEANECTLEKDGVQISEKGIDGATYKADEEDACKSVDKVVDKNLEIDDDENISHTIKEPLANVDGKNKESIVENIIKETVDSITKESVTKTDLPKTMEGVIITSISDKIDTETNNQTPKVGYDISSKEILEEDTKNSAGEGPVKKTMKHVDESVKICTSNSEYETFTEMDETSIGKTEKITTEEPIKDENIAYSRSDDFNTSSHVDKPVARTDETILVKSDKKDDVITVLAGATDSTQVISHESMTKIDINRSNEEDIIVQESVTKIVDETVDKLSSESDIQTVSKSADEELHIDRKALIEVYEKNVCKPVDEGGKKTNDKITASELQEIANEPINIKADAALETNAESSITQSVEEDTGKASEQMTLDKTNEIITSKLATISDSEEHTKPNTETVDEDAGTNVGKLPITVIDNVGSKLDEECFDGYLVKMSDEYNRNAIEESEVKPLEETVTKSADERDIAGTESVDKSLAQGVHKSVDEASSKPDYERGKANLIKSGEIIAVKSIEESVCKDAEESVCIKSHSKKTDDTFATEKCDNPLDKVIEDSVSISVNDNTMKDTEPSSYKPDDITMSQEPEKYIEASNGINVNEASGTAVGEAIVMTSMKLAGKTVDQTADTMVDIEDKFIGDKSTGAAVDKNVSAPFDATVDKAQEIYIETKLKATVAGSTSKSIDICGHKTLVPADPEIVERGAEKTDNEVTDTCVDKVTSKDKLDNANIPVVETAVSKGTTAVVHKIETCHADNIPTKPTEDSLHKSDVKTTLQTAADIDCKAGKESMEVPLHKPTEESVCKNNEEITSQSSETYSGKCTESEILPSTGKPDIDLKEDSAEIAAEKTDIKSTGKIIPKIDDKRVDVSLKKSPEETICRIVGEFDDETIADMDKSPANIANKRVGGDKQQPNATTLRDSDIVSTEERGKEDVEGVVRKVDEKVKMVLKNESDGANNKRIAGKIESDAQEIVDITTNKADCKNIDENISIPIVSSVSDDIKKELEKDADRATEESIHEIVDKEVNTKTDGSGIQLEFKSDEATGIKCIARKAESGTVKYPDETHLEYQEQHLEKADSNKSDSYTSTIIEPTESQMNVANMHDHLVKDSYIKEDGGKMEEVKTDEQSSDLIQKTSDSSKILDGHSEDVGSTNNEVIHSTEKVEQSFQTECIDSNNMSERSIINDKEIGTKSHSAVQCNDAILGGKPGTSEKLESTDQLLHYEGNMEIETTEGASQISEKFETAECTKDIATAVAEKATVEEKCETSSSIELIAKYENISSEDVSKCTELAHKLDNRQKTPGGDIEEDERKCKQQLVDNMTINKESVYGKDTISVTDAEKGLGQTAEKDPIAKTSGNEIVNNRSVHRTDFTKSDETSDTTQTASMLVADAGLSNISQELSEKTCHALSDDLQGPSPESHSDGAHSSSKSTECIKNVVTQLAPENSSKLEVIIDKTATKESQEQSVEQCKETVKETEIIPSKSGSESENATPEKKESISDATTASGLLSTKNNVEQCQEHIVKESVVSGSAYELGSANEISTHSKKQGVSEDKTSAKAGNQQPVNISSEMDEKVSSPSNEGISLSPHSVLEAPDPTSDHSSVKEISTHSEKQGILEDKTSLKVETEQPVSTSSVAEDQLSSPDNNEGIPLSSHSVNEVSNSKSELGSVIELSTPHSKKHVSEDKPSLKEEVQQSVGTIIVADETLSPANNKGIPLSPHNAVEVPVSKSDLSSVIEISTLSSKNLVVSVDKPSTNQVPISTSSVPEENAPPANDEDTPLSPHSVVELSDAKSYLSSGTEISTHSERQVISEDKTSLKVETQQPISTSSVTEENVAPANDEDTPLSPHSVVEVSDAKSYLSSGIEISTHSDRQVISEDKTSLKVETQQPVSASSVAEENEPPTNNESIPISPHSVVEVPDSKSDICSVIEISANSKKQVIIEDITSLNVEAHQPVNTSSVAEENVSPGNNEAITLGPHSVVEVPGSKSDISSVTEISTHSKKQAISEDKTLPKVEEAQQTVSTNIVADVKDEQASPASKEDIPQSADKLNEKRPPKKERYEDENCSNITGSGQDQTKTFIEEQCSQNNIKKEYAITSQATDNDRVSIGKCEIQPTESSQDDQVNKDGQTIVGLKAESKVIPCDNIAPKDIEISEVSKHVTELTTESSVQPTDTINTKIDYIDKSVSSLTDIPLTEGDPDLIGQHTSKREVCSLDRITRDSVQMEVEPLQAEEKTMHDKENKIETKTCRMEDPKQASTEKGSVSPPNEISEKCVLSAGSERPDSCVNDKSVGLMKQHEDASVLKFNANDTRIGSKEDSYSPKSLKCEIEVDTHHITTDITNNSANIPTAVVKSDGSDIKKGMQDVGESQIEKSPDVRPIEPTALADVIPIAEISSTITSQAKLIDCSSDTKSDILDIIDSTPLSTSTVISTSTESSPGSPRTGKIVVRKVTTVITKYYEDGEEVEMEQTPSSEIVEVLGGEKVSEDILRKISKDPPSIVEAKSPPLDSCESKAQHVHQPVTLETDSQQKCSSLIGESHEQSKQSEISPSSDNQPYANKSPASSSTLTETPENQTKHSKITVPESHDDKCKLTEGKPDVSPQNIIKDWGKPLGLPSPLPDGIQQTDNTHTSRASPKRSNSSKSRKRVSPIYLDLAYVPHSANPNYCDIEYFKRIRARYYVFSGIDPGRDVLDALLQAKKEWEDKEQEVTIIPTYDTDALGYWVAANEEALIANKIDLAPSAIRCTINLQDHETSCNAYRLEF